MSPGRRGLLAMGVVVIGAGAAVIGAGLFGDDASLHAPRWVVAAVGATFVLGGLAILRAPGGDAPPPDDVVQALLGALLLGGFALVCGWLLLFTAREEWSVSGLPVHWLPDVVLDVLFYGLVGGMALLVNGLAVAAWAHLVRRAAAALPGRAGAALPWVAGATALAVAAWGGVTLFARPAGPREPLVRLPFDEDLDDAGPHRARASPRGDEVGLRPGVLGRALFVGGTRDWVDYELPAAVDLSASVSLELWVRRDDWVNPYRAGSGTQTIVAVGPLVLGLDRVREGAAGPDRVRPRASVGPVRLRARIVHVAAHRWTHLAVVYDRRWQTARLYVDGERVARAGVYGSSGSRPGGVRIGTWHEANQAFRGEVDELRVYGHALDEAEVRAGAARGR
jgi:hypothetical protein